MAEGIEKRHSKLCRSRGGGTCNCKPTYQASVWYPKSKERERCTFKTQSAAIAWRVDRMRAILDGQSTAGSKILFEQFAEDWWEKAKAGEVRTKKGGLYSPSTLRGYRQVLKKYVYPRIGKIQLGAITRADLLDIVEHSQGLGLQPSTVRAHLQPVQTVFKYASKRQLVRALPTTGLELPSGRGQRDRVIPVHEASRLLDALGPSDRVVYATALFAGPRNGELQALQWPNVSLPTKSLTIAASWDQKEGLKETKSDAGARTVPIPEVLLSTLSDLWAQQGRPAEGFVLGSRTAPYRYAEFTRRTKRAFLAAGLEPATLHECRHSYASYLIAAGVNIKAISKWMGHTSVAFTIDRYGHLMEDAVEVGKAAIDGYLGTVLPPAASDESED